MNGTDGRWLTLATDFPATLNKEARETELEPNESPEAWGMDLDTPGLLAAIDTEPTGTFRIENLQPVTAPQGETISGSMTWLYNRLWRIDDTNSNHLRFSAPDYRSTYFAQRTGLITFTESVTDIIKFVECGRGGLVVCKSDGSWFVPNATDQSGNFTKTQINQAFTLANSGSITTHEGVAYLVNSNGVFSFDGDSVNELTVNVRNDLEPFNDDDPNTDGLLTIDHEKKWLIGGFPDTTWAIDLNNGKLFDYSQTGFRWTSRALRGEDHEPLSIDKVSLMVDHSSADGGQITYQVKVEERDWTDEITLDIDYTDDEYSRFDFHLPEEAIQMCRKWQIRFTSLSSNVRIKEVQVHSTIVEAQDYSS